MNNAKKYLGKPYRYFIFDGEGHLVKSLGKTYQHCSGLVYVSYLNDEIYPFIDLIPMKLRKKVFLWFIKECKDLVTDKEKYINKRYYQMTVPMYLIENPYVDTNYWKGKLFPQNTEGIFVFLF